ncbi:MAG: SRPBCC family protein [Hyphomicrobium sp.]|nr:SRPBCC family protein [Hyphomicrobium sp.]
MKLRFAAAAAIAIAIMAAPVAQAASLAIGKKAEVIVDPKKMTEERIALWERFGGWCSIKDWHPAVESCEASKDGDAELRTLTLKDGGGVIKERLTERKDFAYKYVILESPFPIKNYEAQFALTPDDDDEEEINFAWSAVFDAEGKPDKEARGIMDGVLTAGIKNIELLANPAKK